MNGNHPIHRRLLAEDLTRLRRSDEHRRYAAAQRRGRIDPNPHQIDAVVFALRRIPEGGCILADEVGLGKTIEAGLVIAQLLAEGTRRVLLIVPKSLLGQWQTELYTLFGIEAREGQQDPDSFEGSGVFLVHRELAGGTKGASILKTVDPFELIVVDEAHEIFAGVYKRYDKRGIYNDDSREAVTAGRVRELVKRGGTPVLLLTATPIQNSLAELWGLVQYVEPTGTLLGKLPTFRELFCDGSDRTVLPDQVQELRRRLTVVMQRTLRRQAQAFLEVPFVERQTRLIEYSMSPQEKSLYDDVTRWLMKPDLCAFRGSQRLLLIGFHRRMASSLAALAASLEKVALRLGAQLTRVQRSENFERLLVDDFFHDLEEDAAEFEEPAEVDPESSKESSPDVERVRAELEQVEEFAKRSAALPHDSKARSLLDALRIVNERGLSGRGTGRAIVFTESLTTQGYLRDLLLENGYRVADITLFRGNNESPEAHAALEQWEKEVAPSLPPGNRPSREVALRLALVHEFRERSKVFISTEAGAKGLNLQFCDTLINYDLPWNPQRIEQRIGRIHRYGQRRGVTVMSFLARENETQRLTFEILSQKLDLFGKVLDNSDAILHVPATNSPQALIFGIGVDFETQLRRIYDQARSVDDVTHELQILRAKVEAKRDEFNAEQSRAAELVEERLDDTLRAVFRKYEHELPGELAGLDADIERMVVGYLTAIGVPFERAEIPGRVTLRIGPAEQLPEDYQEGGDVVIGDARDLRDGDVLHNAHPLVQAAIDEARRASSKPRLVRFAGVPESFVGLRGRRGHMVVTKIAYRGIESVDQIVTTALIEGATDPLDSQTLETLLSLVVSDHDASGPFTPSPALEAAVEDAVLENQAGVAVSDRDRFERMLWQLDRYVEDQALLVRRKQLTIEEKIEEAERRRDRALTAAGRVKEDRDIQAFRRQIENLQERIAKLESGDDPDYQLWRNRLHERRFRRPHVQRLLEVEFEIVGGGLAVVLTILHTADLHLGHISRQLDAETARKLARARLGAVDTILGLAQQYDVRAVVCAGDIFDTAQPEPDWWRGLASAFTRNANWHCPVILLPGNHDPLIRDSVYERGHAFRRALPSWVHVVDHDDFELELGPEAVVYATPCRSTAGADDPSLALPGRIEGDERIRIGLVHGSTFDLPGCQTNFPIARDATQQRGLDYLAIGDWHGFRIIPENGIAPIVYPGSPEPTNFKEHGAGNVAIVSFRGRGIAPRIRKERIARWTWREETVNNIVELRKIASEDLSTTILRLHLDMTASIEGNDEIAAILRSLAGTLASHGRAAALIPERKNLRIEASPLESNFEDAPDAIREVAAALREQSASCEKSRRGLVLLYRMWNEVR